MRYDVLKAAMLKIQVSCYMTPCYYMHSYWQFTSALTFEGKGAMLL